MNIKEVTRSGLENTHQDTLFNNAQFSIGIDILLSVGLVNFAVLVLNIMTSIFSIPANTKKRLKQARAFGNLVGVPNPLALGNEAKNLSSYCLASGCSPSGYHWLTL